MENTGFALSELAAEAVGETNTKLSRLALLLLLFACLEAGEAAAEGETNTNESLLLLLLVLNVKPLLLLLLALGLLAALWAAAPAPDQ